MTHGAVDSENVQVKVFIYIFFIKPRSLIQVTDANDFKVISDYLFFPSAYWVSSAYDSLCLNSVKNNVFLFNMLSLFP